ncbi:MAG: FtsX-like permease family protein [Bacteroidales bacterium]
MQDYIGNDQTKIIILNFEQFVAFRMLKKDRENFSRPIIRIAITAIALGVAIMLIATAVVTGFQKSVTEKVTGFSSHIQVVSYNNNKSWQIDPIDKHQNFLKELEKNPDIKHIQAFGLKAGILKHQDQILGSVLKGVDQQYDWSFIQENLIRGKLPHITDSAKSNEIIISSYHARKLHLDTGQSVLMYFVQDPPRYYKFDITGIYSSGIEELDQRFILCDNRYIQNLNNWNEEQVAGYEIFLHDINKLEEYTTYIYEQSSFDLKVENINTLNPQIMDWLEMLNTNVVIILSLMLIVSAITMVSTLLILILEKTAMIGVFKAMGSTNRSIRNIFLMNTLYIAGKGLLWGNIIGLSILLIQKLTGVISLDEATYFMAYAPVNFNIIHILLINTGTLLTCLIFMLFPAYMVSRISPVNAIRFE